MPRTCGGKSGVVLWGTTKKSSSWKIQEIFVKPATVSEGSLFLWYCVGRLDGGEGALSYVMSLQGHTARREHKVSVGSRESMVQWCDGSEEVSTTKYRQKMRGIQWIAR